MRPNVEITPAKEALFIYLITPAGEVWHSREFSIPENVSRQVVVEEKTDFGTSTTTTTINSSSEPIIDHFKKNETSWTKYGDLKSNDGQKFSLHLLKEN